MTGCPNVKVSPLLKFKLITVSAKMLYQLRGHGKFSEVREKSGKMRVEKERPPFLMFFAKI